MLRLSLAACGWSNLISAFITLQLAPGAAETEQGEWEPPLPAAARISGDRSWSLSTAAGDEQRHNAHSPLRVLTHPPCLS